MTLPSKPCQFKSFSQDLFSYQFNHHWQRSNLTTIVFQSIFLLFFNPKHLCRNQQPKFLHKFHFSISHMTKKTPLNKGADAQTTDWCLQFVLFISEPCLISQYLFKISLHFHQISVECMRKT